MCVCVILYSNYMADTGADAADMKTQVAAYRNTMTALVKKVVPMGGYWWQLMDGGGNKLAAKNVSTATCKSTLATLCKPKPDSWDRMQLYNIPSGGKGLKEDTLKQYTAEFLLTRGPYAMLGYSWYAPPPPPPPRPPPPAPPPSPPLV
eukprot:COSAG03_NODE_796_length_5819_cov_19.619755_8_plen_147_part_01